MIARFVVRFWFNSIQGFRFSVLHHERRRTRILRGLYLAFLCGMGAWDLVTGVLYIGDPVRWPLAIIYPIVGVWMFAMSGLMVQSWRRSDLARRARQAWSADTVAMFRTMRDMFTKGSRQWREFDRLAKMLEN